MPSYRLIQHILNESKSQDPLISIDEGDFTFSCRPFATPAQLHLELQELERLGYIVYKDHGSFAPTYSAFHWKRDLILRIARYVGYSIVTPILVTLLTMLVTGALKLPG